MQQYWQLQVKIGGFEWRDFLLPAPAEHRASLLPRPCTASQALKWSRAVYERLGFESGRIKSLTLPSARVTAPDAAHRVGIKPEDRRWLGRWQAPADQAMTDVYSRQQVKVVVGIWQQLVSQWPDSNIGNLSPQPYPVCLSGPGSGLEADEEAQRVQHHARSTAVPRNTDLQDTKRAKTQHNVPSESDNSQAVATRTQLLAAAMYANQRFHIRFVLNAFSRKLHAVELTETKDITRGCRWSYTRERVVELPDLDAVMGVPAIPCEVCLSVASIPADILALAEKKAAEDVAPACSMPPSTAPGEVGSDSEQEITISPFSEDAGVLASTLQLDA